MIYFIRDTRTRWIKIGRSKTPWRRLIMLQTGSASPLEMLAVIEGADAEESALHDRFAAERERGEWFRGAGALNAYVAGLLVDGDTVAQPARAEGWGELARISRITGISVPHLCDLRYGRRTAAWSLALVYQRTGHKFGVLASMPDADVATWARVTLAIRDARTAEPRAEAA